MKTVNDLLDGITDVGIAGVRGEPSYWTVINLRALLRKIQQTYDVILHVGDATGVDRTALIYGPSKRVTVYPVIGPRSPANLVRRTQQQVNAVALTGPRGLYIAFPDTTCPDDLLPNAQANKCFAGQVNVTGKKSGTWKALAYAAGLFLRDGWPRCAVYLPPALPLPEEPPWDFQPLEESGWYEVLPFSEGITTEVENKE